MNWKTIAAFLGVSERTLSRRRIEYGIFDSFSEIPDEELDSHIENILHLTPYSGEVYVIGSLKARNVNVQSLVKNVKNLGGGGANDVPPLPSPLWRRH